MLLNWDYGACTAIVTVKNANLNVRLKLFQIACLRFPGMKSNSCGLIKVLTCDLSGFKGCFTFTIPAIKFYAVSADSCSLNSDQKLFFYAYLNSISVNCSAYSVLQDVARRQLLFLVLNVISAPHPIFTFCKWMHSLLLLNILINTWTV